MSDIVLKNISKRYPIGFERFQEKPRVIAQIEAIEHPAHEAVGQVVQ